MGIESIDDNLLGLIGSLRDFFSQHFSDLIRVGQVIGAIMSLFLAASVAYKVMLRQEGFDVMEIMRPIAISIVLMTWEPMCLCLAYPFRLLENSAKGMYDTQVVEVALLKKSEMHEVYKLDSLTLQTYTSAQMQATQYKDKEIIDYISDVGESIWSSLADVVTLVSMNTQSMLKWIFEWLLKKIGGLFLQFSIFYIFFIKELLLGLLCVTGPITFAFSILPTWKGAWSQWVSRYITVCLYGFLAYFILVAGMQLIKYGYSVDVAILSKANSSREAWWAFTKSGMLSRAYSFMGILITAKALLLVPELASWIIPTNAVHGASSFVNGMNRSTQGAASLAIKAAKL